MRWLPSFIVCMFAAILPWRLRQWFITALAVWSQAMYFMYAAVIKFLLKSLGGGKKAP